MNIKRCFEKALAISKATLEDYLFKCKYRRHPKDFSREKKMNFITTICFTLNLVKKSLQVELNNFFEKISKADFTVSKQAYSEARKKIDPGAFIELNNKITEFIYKECNDLELWNGYRLSAIDGTVLEIPNTELLRSEFGSGKNQNGEVARARAACIYDVLNKIVIQSKIDRLDVSEKTIAMKIINQMQSYEKYKDLIIFDRGYPSAEMVAFLCNKKIDFLMRVKQSFSKQIKNAIKKDQIITMIHEGKKYPVRVLRVMISDDVEEVLITSLLDKNITTNDFKKLYFIRWKVEIKYDELKNRLQIENFTGESKVAIEQDFYASIYLSNMIELARKQSDQIISSKQEDKELKYQYKTNLNVLIGALKDKFIIMMLEKSRYKRSKMFKSIMKTVSNSAIPIRDDRQFPRKMFLVRSKFQLNKKRCL